MQTHATSQLHRARAVHVPLIAVVCVMGCCICMLVCGMSCHMPTSLSQLYACFWWLHSYACLWYVMSHAYLAIAVVCLFVVCHVTCTCTCHMDTTLGENHSHPRLGVERPAGGGFIRSGRPIAPTPF